MYKTISIETKANFRVVNTSSVGLVHQDDLIGKNGQVPSYSATVDQSAAVNGNKALAVGDLTTRQARAIMDYEAVSPQEMSIRQNDVLIVYRLPGLDPEFVMAEKSGKRGRVPLSFLEII
uniref:SH3 domain-containing protein n=1 Tax=Panagrolaimus sp. JU765 TaxID=591449 RepID=A0AC34R0Z3_9BILA